jgi:ssDNA-binding Zn-finger/Zn-ribbon topoisomerase 1
MLMPGRYPSRNIYLASNENGEEPLSSFKEKETIMNEQTQLQNPAPCPECRGERVRAQAGPYGFQLIPEQSGKIFKPSSGTVTLVCIACGYTSWYATEPEKLIGKPSRS